MLGIYSLTYVLNYKHKTHTYLRCHHPQALLSLGCRPITHSTIMLEVVLGLT
jgi:hypothetical protein